MKKCRHREQKRCCTEECTAACHTGLANGCRSKFLCKYDWLECDENCDFHKVLGELIALEEEKSDLQNACSLIKMSISKCNKKIKETERKLENLKRAK